VSIALGQHLEDSTELQWKKRKINNNKIKDEE